MIDSGDFVWVVEIYNSSRDSYVFGGVFSTEEKAIEFAGRGRSKDDYIVTANTLDSELEE